MSRRFIITGVVIAALLGGLSYFQFYFKPQMIRSFLSQMKPPAGDRRRPSRHAPSDGSSGSRSIGTLIASQGVDIATQVAGVVTEVLIESGKEVEQGTQAGPARYRGRACRPCQRRGDAAGGRRRLRAPDRADRQESYVGGQRSMPRAPSATPRRQPSSASRPSSPRKPSRRRSPAASASARWRRASTSRPAWRWSPCRRSIPSASTFPMPEQTHRQAARRPDHRADGRRVSRPGLQGRDPVARCARGAGHAHAAGAGLLPNPERKLLPGMFANVTVLAGEPAEVVTVPRTAITYSLYGDSVYVVKPAAGRSPASLRRPAPGQGPVSHSSLPSAASSRPARSARTASPSHQALPSASRW